MSFSSDVKEELSKISNKNKECCKLSELAGYLITNCNIARSNGDFVLKMTTESESAIRRVYNAFRSLYDVTPITNIEKKIEGRDTLLELVVQDKSDLQKIFSNSWINIDVNLHIVIDTNIKALLAMTRLIVPGMVERKRGHIINIGSIAGDAAYPGGSVYCATKAAVKALSDGLRIDLVDTPLRVTNIKPGLVETNFSVVRFRGDKEKADNVYKGIRPLTGDDIAETVYFAASVPEYMQIAEMLVMPTNQATGTIVSRK